MLGGAGGWGRAAVEERGWRVCSGRGQTFLVSRVLKA